MLVARLGGEVVGCVGLAADPPGVVELVKMAVSPAHQGHGTGRALIAAATGRARDARGDPDRAREQPAAGGRRPPLRGQRLPAPDRRRARAGPYARADVAMALDLARDLARDASAG